MNETHTNHAIDEWERELAWRIDDAERRRAATSALDLFSNYEFKSFEEITRTMITR